MGPALQSLHPGPAVSERELAEHNFADPPDEQLNRTGFPLVVPPPSIVFLRMCKMCWLRSRRRRWLAVRRPPLRVQTTTSFQPVLVHLINILSTLALTTAPRATFRFSAVSALTTSTCPARAPWVL